MQINQDRTDEVRQTYLQSPTPDKSWLLQSNAEQCDQSLLEWVLDWMNSKERG